MGVIDGTLAYNAGNKYSSVLGNGDSPRLGPGNLYAGNETPTAFAGDVSATDSATLTGNLTTFITEGLQVGDFIYFDTDVSITYEVLEVNSETEIVIDTAVTVAAATVSRSNLIWLGCSLQTTLRYGESKTELFEAQKGATRADMALTGYQSSIEHQMTRAGLLRLQTTIGGMNLHRDANGVVDGAGFSFDLGATDLNDYAVRLHFVRIDGGVESSSPTDHLIIPKAAFTAEVEQVFDAESQHSVTVTANAYVDDATTLDGKSLLWFLGNIT